MSPALRTRIPPHASVPILLALSSGLVASCARTGREALQEARQFTLVPTPGDRALVSLNLPDRVATRPARGTALTIAPSDGPP